MRGFVNSSANVPKIAASIAVCPNAGAFKISRRTHRARQHEGKDTPENLALACHHCNFHKGTNLSGIDPQTGELTRLFHPRLDDWKEHFRLGDGEVVGVTVIARATVKLFRMNEDGRRELRRI